MGVVESFADLTNFFAEINGVLGLRWKNYFQINK